MLQYYLTGVMSVIRYRNGVRLIPSLELYTVYENFCQNIEFRCVFLTSKI